MDETSEPSLHYIEYYEDFLARVRFLARTIDEAGWLPDFVIGVGRGGLVPAVYLSHHFELPMLSIDHSSKMPGFADELLAKVFGQFLRDDTAGNVIGTARRPGDDHPHRLGRVGLRLHGKRQP